nr:hypothetical protein [Tanacetum cinerariifolium]
MEELCETLRNEVPELTVSTTNDLMKDSLPKTVADAIKKDKESSQAIVPILILQEFDAHAPKIIKELFRIHIQNTVLNVHPTTSTSTTTTSDLQQQLYLKRKSNLQAQVADLDLWDVLKAKFEKSSTSDALAGMMPFANAIMMNIKEMMLLQRGRKERVHDFKLGKESYQIKINLTTVTLIFPDIDACNPYSIIDEPTTGLIYLNINGEKRVMHLIDITKFCDATLENVLKEVKMKIFETEFMNNAPLL